MASRLEEWRVTMNRAKVVSVRNRRVSIGIVAMAIAALAAALVLAATVGSRGAEAAFPGTNGKIVFDSDRSSAAGGPALYTITPGSTATKIPGTSTGDNQPVWSPDGSRIAFQSSSGSTNQEISVMNADGSGRTQITDTTTVTNSIAEGEPAWSPDGSQIAFVANKSGSDTTTDQEIWVMNADGSGRTQLTNTVQGVRDTHPAWSPDGDKIAFLGEGRDGTNSNIYVMDTNPATDDAFNLTPNTSTPVYQYNDEDPSWSPDGTQIAYSTIGDVWKIDVDGTDRTNLTSGTGGTNPAWSPNGNSIVYVRTGDIYVMDADDGGNKTAVETTPRQDIKPDWQPILPKISITDVRVKEKVTNAVFTVQLAVASDQTITVKYSTTNGSAQAPADYTATSGTLTFMPGQTTKTVAVPIKSDRRKERNEVFFVNLSDVINTTIADGQGRATIVDND